MKHFGVSIESGRFEIVAGEDAVGARRDLDEAAVRDLNSVTERYGAILRARTGAGAVLALGRELYRWLDGDRGQLTTLVDRAPRPFLFEVRGPARPSQAEWALLRAPFELLADDEGFLAQNALLRFCPLRRLGQGRTAPRLDRHRLGVVFMAAAPRGQVELDYEAEETAILEAVSTRQIDLVVEESGDPVELGTRLRELDTMQAVHLSCHGLNRWRPADQPDAAPKPILLLEDPEGGGRPTDAVELMRGLRPTPRLLFLSACLSAAGADRSHAPGYVGDKTEGAEQSGAATQVAHSLATALVEAGMPAVLGWEGSVADAAATAFAAHCYAALARETDIGEAVAEGRRALLGNTDEAIRADWHLARLWLGPEGGGAIIGGDRKRSLLPRSHGHKVFLDARGQVPVASPEMFVGRRRQLQQALHSLRGDEHAGVLLYGPGRRGKSSLAARIVSRSQDRMVPAVVYKHYDALSVVEVLETALQPWPAARELVQQRKAGVREDKARLQDLFVDLLCRPCREASDETRPLLLIIDDLERILVPDPAGGRHRVEPPHGEVLAMVLRAFNPATTDSRLILTSRYPFSLEGLEKKLNEIHVPPLSEAAQRKLELRQKSVALEADQAPPDLAARLALLSQTREVARGNPGLQDLIGQKLMLSKEVPLPRAQAALAQMKTWLGGGDVPEEAAVREFLESLAMDTLLDLASASGRGLLAALATFDLPVPLAVVEAVANEVGGTPLRLCDLGLLDVFEDLVDHRNTAFAVHALAAPRLAAPTDELRTAVASLAALPLFAAWGGRARPRIADLQLARLGLRAGDAGVVAASAVGAMHALEGGKADERARLGQDAIALLEVEGQEVPWRLVSQTAAAIATMGEGTIADALFAKGVAALEAKRRAGEEVDRFEAAYLLVEQARRLVRRGEPGEAERLFKEAAELLAGMAGQEPSVAAVRGEIADILQSRGALDEALRIRTEEQLPVLERLGEVREVAITKGKIADIHFSRGALDEALRIRTEEELPVFERLGEVRAVAITKGKIADILQSRGALDEALRIRTEEQLPVYERLGEVRAVAITKGKIADILQSRGALDEALRIRTEEELPVYERLGEVRSVAITKGEIADILQSRGALDEALRIRTEEELPVYERLGEVREVAITKGKIADILQSRGALDEALRIRTEEQLPVFERLGEVRAVAITKGQIADILQSRGALDEALRIRTEEQLPVFERLGEVREVAITKGKIADILQSRGALDEALRIRTEEELPVFERLGEVREVAITKGRIAHILMQMGDLDAARELHLERLDTHRKLQDADAIAGALWDLALIDLSRQDFDEAVHRLAESYAILEKTARAEGLAVVGLVFGQRLAAAGERERAVAVLRTSAEASRMLGQAEQAREAEELIGQLM